MARATGSYPVGHGFKSNSRYQVVRQYWRTTHIRPVGQAAKTPPFHGGNGSSILPRVTKKGIHHSVYAFFDDSIEIERAAGAVRRVFRFCPAKRRRSAVEENSALSVVKHILPRIFTFSRQIYFNQFASTCNRSLAH